MQQQDYQTATRDIKSSESWKTSGYRSLYKSLFYNSDNSDNSDGLQSIHTPFELCSEILDKLIKFSDIKNANIAVLFNLEFVDILIEKFKINPDNITFFTDSKRRSLAAKEWYKVNNIIEIQIEGKNIIMPKPKQEFDVIIMNPPYQSPVLKSKTDRGSKGSRNAIWPEFVNMAIVDVKDNGFLAAIHPPKWRKPEDKLFKIMTEQNITYLEMHSKKDGIKTFGAMTPFDWYILQKAKYSGKTNIKCTDGAYQTIDLREFPFLPSCDLKKVTNLLAKNKDEKCEVLFSRSAYASDKHWVSEIKTDKFAYPCVHSTTKDKVRYWYSSTNKNGFFGTPKVIFGDNGGDTGIFNAIVDMEGVFGITQHAMAIPISSKDEGEQIKKALESESFKKIINSCQYGGFQIDWRMFPYFRKDFWKEFI